MSLKDLDYIRPEWLITFLILVAYIVWCVFRPKGKKPG